MKSGLEVIEFNLFGLYLQEPMTMVTDWMIAGFCFYAYTCLQKGESNFQNLWKAFFLVIGLSTFLGGLGHLFFQYTGYYGKFPSWFFGILAGVYASMAMISTIENQKVKGQLNTLVLIKSLIFLGFSIVKLDFGFVAVDTSITYLIFCGYYAYHLKKKAWEGVHYFYFGVLALLPTGLIFGLKINLSAWLNKNDLSHLFMLTCLVFFFFGVRNTQKLMQNRLR